MASQSLDGILLGIGNPLLDISAHVESSLLTKYDLKPGNAILADEKKHLPLYDELVRDYKVEYIAGGAAQNSIRACQWMLQHPGAVGYIGAVGKDENGKRLKEAAEQGGAKTYYYEVENVPTGACAVLVQNKERSLVANLGAANHYKKEHFDSEAVQKVVQNARFYYATGFFLTVCPDALVSIGKHCVANGKTFLFNLAAPFVIDFFTDPLKSVLPYTDVVFGNETEFETFGKKFGFGTDLIAIAKELVRYNKEGTSGRTRTVIVTQGAKATLVVSAKNNNLNDITVETFTPIKCPAEEIVDTNGAGDSFVGGFLSQFVQAKPIETCVKAGHYAAWECIRRSGATYPPKPNFTP